MFPERSFAVRVIDLSFSFAAPAEPHTIFWVDKPMDTLESLTKRSWNESEGCWMFLSRNGNVSASVYPCFIHLHSTLGPKQHVHVEFVWDRNAYEEWRDDGAPVKYMTEQRAYKLARDTLASDCTSD